MAGADDRPDIDGFIQTVAEPHSRCAVDQPLDQLAFEPRDGRSTRLAAVQRWPDGAERAPENAVRGEVEVGVVHDDHGVFAAHFQRDALIQRAPRGRNGDAGFGRAGETRPGHVRMRDDRVAHVGTAAEDEVDHAGGKPSFFKDLDEPDRERGVNVAGLKTTVLPAIRAGMIFQDGIAIGKFQGVIIPATPSGLR